MYTRRGALSAVYRASIDVMPSAVGIVVDDDGCMLESLSPLVHTQHTDLDRTALLLFFVS